MTTAISYSASGTKSAAKVTLDKQVFSIEVKNHALLKDAYVAYQSNGRLNLAKVKTRGEVSGSTKKPWKQKGTGRARFGSRYNPIWRGGGITFGPTGNENYTKKLNVTSKRLAVKQALSLAASTGAVKTIDSFECKDGKVKSALAILKKVETSGRTLIVVHEKTESISRAVRNIQDVKAVQATYLNVFDILNADSVLVDKKALDDISAWLTQKEAK
jgi:large subunit ribosomal protein L4